MALRLVIDADGTAWHVWSVPPHEGTRRVSLALSPQYAAGWLAFEQAEATGGTAAEKRRVAPLPTDWEKASDAAVLTLLASAVPVQRRALPPS